MRNGVIGREFQNGIDRKWQVTGVQSIVLYVRNVDGRENELGSLMQCADVHDAEDGELRKNSMSQRMKNENLICEYCGKSTVDNPYPGYCDYCETFVVCHKKYGELYCLRKPNHTGPCSPMHFKVFSLEVQLDNAFESGADENADT